MIKYLLFFLLYWYFKYYNMTQRTFFKLWSVTFSILLLPIVVFNATGEVHLSYTRLRCARDLKETICNTSTGHDVEDKSQYCTYCMCKISGLFLALTCPDHHTLPLPGAVYGPHMSQEMYYCPCTEELFISLPEQLWPVALTSVFMKCFERLIKDHICFSLPNNLGPLQFAYLQNRSRNNGNECMHAGVHV